MTIHSQAFNDIIYSAASDRAADGDNFTYLLAFFLAILQFIIVYNGEQLSRRPKIGVYLITINSVLMEEIAPHLLSKTYFFAAVRPVWVYSLWKIYLVFLEWHMDLNTYGCSIKIISHLGGLLLWIRHPAYSFLYHLSWNLTILAIAPSLARFRMDANLLGRLLAFLATCDTFFASFVQPFYQFTGMGTWWLAPFYVVALSLQIGVLNPLMITYTNWRSGDVSFRRSIEQVPRILKLFAWDPLFNGQIEGPLQFLNDYVAYFFGKSCVDTLAMILTMFYPPLGLFAQSFILRPLFQEYYKQRSPFAVLLVVSVELLQALNNPYHVIIAIGHFSTLISKEVGFGFHFFNNVVVALQLSMGFDASWLYLSSGVGSYLYYIYSTYVKNNNLTEGAIASMMLQFGMFIDCGIKGRVCFVLHKMITNLNERQIAIYMQALTQIFEEYRPQAGTPREQAIEMLNFVQGLNEEILINQGGEFRFHIAKITACVFANMTVGQEYIPTLRFLNLVNTEDFEKWQKGGSIINIYEFNNSVITIMRMMVSGDSHIEQVNTQQDFVTLVAWCEAHRNLRYDNTGPPVPGRIPEDMFRKKLALLSDAKRVLKYRRYDSLPPQVYQKACEKLMDLQLMEARVAARNGKRPFVVAMHGSPGSGKSTVIAPVLAWHLLKMMGIEKDLSSCREWIFTKTASSEYWEGYDMLRHHVVIIDEINGVDAKVVSPKWVTDLNMVLSEPGCPLNMAFEKGEYFMVAKVIILISNFKDFGMRGLLNDWTSFIRRPDFALETVVPSDKGALNRGIGVSRVINHETSLEVLNRVRVIPLQGTNNGFISMLEPERGRSMKRGGEPARHRKDDETISMTEMLTFLKGIYYKYLATDDSMKEVFSDLNKTFVPGTDYTDVVQRLYETNRLEIPAEDVEAKAWTDIYSINTDDQYTLFDQSRDWVAAGINLLIGLGSFLNPLPIFIFGAGVPDIIVPFARVHTILYHPPQSNNLAALIEYRHHHNEAQARTKYLWYGMFMVFAFTGMKLAYDYYKRQEEKVEPQAPIKGLSQDEYEAVIGSPPKKFNDPTGNPYDMSRGRVFPEPKAGNTPLDVIERQIVRNTIIIKISLGKAHVKCHLMGLYSDVYVGPYHSLRLAQLPEATIEVVIFRQVKNGPIEGFPTNRVVNAVDLIERLTPTSDLAVIRLTSLPPCMDMRNLLCKAVQFPHGGTMPGIHIFRDIDSKIATQYAPSKVWNFTYMVPEYNSLSAYRVSCEGQAMMSPVPCVEGMCGSSLVVEVRKGVHALIGSYTSGALKPESDSVHCFELFSKSLIDDAVLRISGRTMLIQPMSNIYPHESVQIAMLDRVEVDTEANKFDEFDWLEADVLPNLFYFGHMYVPTQHPKTRVKFTPMAEDYKRMLPAEYQTTLIPPIFSPLIDRENGIYLSPTRNAILDLAHPAQNINLRHLDVVVAHLVDKYSQIEAFCHDQVVDKYAAINGSCLSPFISSMKLNTAMGFPFDGKKNKFVYKCPSETAPDGVMFEDSVLTVWDIMLQTYASGRRCGVVYKGSDKDEPRKIAKVDARQIRKFTCLCICTLGIEKMYMAIFIGIWLKNFNRCETVGGVNPFSRDWRDVYTRLSKHKRGFNGDIKHYDKVVSQQLLIAGFSVIYHVKTHFGFFRNQAMRNVFIGLVSDITNPIYLFGRTLFQANGSVPSGDFMTFFINTIVNQILIRMAWLHVMEEKTMDKTVLRQSLFEFDDNVEFTAAGDDNLSTVSEKYIERFNFDTVKKFFDSICIEYTPADKGDTSYRYQSFETLDICKRRFIYNEEYDWVCAPIEKVSITKFLYIHLLSDTISEQQQIEEGVRMIPYELAMHGREEYNRMIPLITSLLDKHAVAYQFPTYECMMQYITQNEENPWLSNQGKPTLDMEGYWLSCDAIANQRVVMVTAIDEFLSTDSDSGTLTTDSENLYLQSSSRVLPITPALLEAMTQSKIDTSSDHDPKSDGCTTTDS